MEIEIKSIPPIPGPYLARNRGLVRKQVESCTACGLVCGMPKGPVPYSGPIDPWFLAIGEGPGGDEANVGRPFVGRSGKLLRAMLGSVGIPAERVMFANVVSCWPKTSDGRDTRQPTNLEAQACRANLIAQVDLVRVPYILLVGGTALRSVRPDLKVSRHHGVVFLWDNIYSPDVEAGTGTYHVMPILHPAAILRQRAHKEPTIKELRVWADIVKGETDPWAVRSDDCVICGEWLAHYDPDGIGYCERHWDKHGSDWRRARELWLPKGDGGDDGPGQGTLI